MRTLLFVILITARAVLAQGFTLADGAFVSTSAIRSAGLTPPVFVRAGTNGTASAVSTLTISAFNCSGGNLLLVGIVEHASLTRTVSSVTCNSVSCTQLATTTFNGSAGLCRIYSLASPTTGDVTVTLNNTANSTGMSICALLFSGANTSSFGTASTSGVTASTSVTVSPASLTSDLVIEVFGYNGGITATPGASQTVIALNNVSSASSIGASYKTAGSPTTTVSWSTTGGGGPLSEIGVGLHGQ
jgi:hypothetical protein